MPSRAPNGRLGGPPGSATTATGSKFGAFRAIDVSFDASDVGLVATTATGGFTFKLTVPAGATPGAHSVTAIQRPGGPAVSATFTVNTNWVGFKDGPRNLGAISTENLLSPSTVNRLDLDWTDALTTDGSSAGDLSPAIVEGTVYVSANVAGGRAPSRPSIRRRAW